MEKIMSTEQSHPDNEEKPQVISAHQARGGFIGWHVITILAVSLTLAAIVMVVLLNLNWRW